MFKSLIQTDTQGIVRNTVLDVEQYNYSIDSFSSPIDPVIIDNELAVSAISRGRIEEGSQIYDTVFVNPYTEQVLGGTLYGGFKLNEQVYQTPITVEIVNFLNIDGVTASEYNPTIGTIGVTNGESRHSAKFYGTFSDLPLGKGAGLRLPKFNSQSYSYFSGEGFVYFESLPSAYDPILISRGINSSGGGSTQDSFEVEYDVSSRRLMLNYTMGSAAGGTSGVGYENYLPISPIDGVTTNKWHHFCFSAAVGISYPSDPMQPGFWVVYLGTFFDGVRCGYNEFTFYDDVASSSTPQENTLNATFRQSTAPLTIGCGFSGERPLKGWLDSVLFSGGRSPTALRGHDPQLSGITVPSKDRMAVGEYTLYHLNMNGPLGTSLFPCDTPCRVVSSASYISNDEGKLGVAVISRQVSQAPSIYNGYTLSPWHGITLFEGVCFGHAITQTTASPCFGTTSKSCLFINNIEQLHGLTVAKDIRKNAAKFTTSYLLGSTAMWGSGATGACADFRRLFSRNWGGNTFTYLATQTNTTELKFTYDSIQISGRTGTFYIEDYSSGSVYGVQTADVKNLYADVVEYHSLVVRLGLSAAAVISGITNMQNLYNTSGFGEEAIVRRVAPRMENVGILLINNNGRMSKITTRPELVYSPYVTEGLFKQLVTGIGGSNPPWYPNLSEIPY